MACNGCSGVAAAAVAQLSSFFTFVFCKRHCVGGDVRSSIMKRKRRKKKQRRRNRFCAACRAFGILAENSGINAPSFPPKQFCYSSLLLLTVRTN